MIPLLSAIDHQARAISLIRRALRGGRGHHAYLFAGPEGVGKELVARALAVRLLCECDRADPDADACGACPSCRLMAADNHPDFHLIHRGLHKLHPDPGIRRGKGLTIAVDVVRHFLIEHAALTPSRGRARIFLVRDAERMNEGAQNALLKTLEEPPGRTRLILVSSSAARLLTTIRSRCQCVPFAPLPADYVSSRLESVGVPSDAARSLARLSDGRLGVALRWHALGVSDVMNDVALLLREPPAGTPEAFAKRLLAVADGLARRSVRLDRGDSVGNSDFADEEGAGDDADDEAAEDSSDKRSATKDAPTDALRDALRLVLAVIASAFRDALIVSSGGDARLLALPAHRAALKGLLCNDWVEPVDAVRAVARAESMLDRNVAPQLALEALAVTLTGAAPIHV